MTFGRAVGSGDTMETRMARYELTKTIEARKLNARSGLPLTEPPVSIPYTGIVEKVEESWDVVKFTYLGAHYQVATSTFQEAARAVGTPGEGGETSASSPLAAAAAPAPVAKEVQVRWEELSSNQGAVLRAKVPGGWLVAVRGSGAAFYPDPEHGWDGKTLS
jgi:hypothetical protein